MSKDFPTHKFTNKKRPEWIYCKKWSECQTIDLVLVIFGINSSPGCVKSANTRKLHQPKTCLLFNEGFFRVFSRLSKFQANGYIWINKENLHILTLKTKISKLRQNFAIEMRRGGSRKRHLRGCHGTLINMDREASAEHNGMLFAKAQPLLKKAECWSSSDLVFLN
jgi:hypothetical protein